MGKIPQGLGRAFPGCSAGCPGLIQVLWGEIWELTVTYAFMAKMMVTQAPTLCCHWWRLQTDLCLTGMGPLVGWPRKLGHLYQKGRFLRMAMIWLVHLGWIAGLPGWRLSLTLPKKLVLVCRLAPLLW